MSSDNLLTLKIPAGKYCGSCVFLRIKNLSANMCVNNSSMCVLFNEELIGGGTEEVVKCEQCDIATWKLEAEQGNS
jgi:hypothetical protein